MTSTVLHNNTVRPSTATAAQAPAASRFSAMMKGLWAQLEASGRRRAARELRERAIALESTQPSFARELREAADAALRG